MEARLSTMIQQQGLLSVPLLHRQAAGMEYYALLNGSKNNLCLDGRAEQASEWYRKMAWSSGNNTFLGFSGGQCHIFRFDRPQIESYDAELVFENADRFIAYLGQGVSNVENSIVPYVLRTYRQIRNELRTENSGADSLRALLYLLAYSRDKDQLNLDDWGLTARVTEIIQTINGFKWASIVEQFMKGVCFTDKWLKPDIDLILRHTAGKLFEEANYMAYLPSQLTLFPDEKIRYSYATQQDGAYFTPSYVARSIVEECLSHVNLQGKEHLTIFDPSCGASGFLVEVLRQLKKLPYERPVHVMGWDKAETAVMMSNFVLSFEKQEWGDLLTCDIQHCDSLAEANAWPQNVDILLMNPPFLSWDRMKDSPELRDRVREIVPEIPKANLSAAFLAKAVESVAQGGVLGVVVPTQLLNDQSYERLRNRMREQMSLRLIGGLGSYVFENVLAYTSMVVATKEYDPYGPTTVLWTNNDTGAASDGLKALRKHRYTNAIMEDKDYSVYEYQVTPEQRTWRIDNYKNLALKQLLIAAAERGLLKKVNDLFDIQQGVRTGDNKTFVVPEEFLMTLPKNERAYFRPASDNLAIDMGHLYKINYVFYPYTKGLELIENEEQLHALLPETYQNLLLPAKRNLSARTSLRGNPRWWELSEHRTYLEEKRSKLISTEFGHAGSFAIDYSGDFVVQRGHIWNLNPKKFTPRLKYEESYLAFFTSSYMNTLLEFFGDRLAGAEVYRLGASYVKNVLLPDFSQSIFDQYIPELRRFAKLMKADEYWETTELNALVNEMMKHVE